MLNVLSKNTALAKCNSASNLKLNVDKAALGDYVLRKVTEIVKGGVTKNLDAPTSCPELPLDKAESNQSEKKTASCQSEVVASFKSVKETKLSESVYEPFNRSSVEEIKKETKTESFSSSKSLTDSCGFHFVMK